MNAISEAKVEAAPLARRRYRARRTPLTWVRRGGFTTFVFMLPMLRRLRGVLVVPDRPHGGDGVPAHQPRAGADVGGAAELQRRHPRPADAGRREEHRLLRAPRARLRLSDPARSGRADERGAEAPRPVQRARLPAGRDPARRRGAPVEDLLRRERDRRLQHDLRLGRPRARTPGSSRTRGRCRRSCSSRRGRTQARR